jgi:lipopolysaccharide transport system ATP-binding protein
MTPIIEVKNLVKMFPLEMRRVSLRHEAQQLLTRWVNPEGQGRQFAALRGISFTINEGEHVAILGRNGAGKTTLLRVLSGITLPTSGTVNVRGRFAALIGVSAGFDAARTGRENIFLNAALQGVFPKDMRHLEKDIIDFAELEEFIDMPVKTYSSGMIARLGFSVAIHILPDIILLDEVLAVGDGAFRDKCLDRINQVMQTRTVLFVSHSLEMVTKICKRAIWLHEGIVQADGPVTEVTAAYQAMLNASNA